MKMLIIGLAYIALFWVQTDSKVGEGILVQQKACAYSMAYPIDTSVDL